MKRNICNPIFPLHEYVPDGEPHVFGDRVYLYGSHDAANANRFCVKDYTVWSAPVNDLSDWTNHGVTYRKEQDPRSKDGKLADLTAGTKAVYKYFDLSRTKKITVSYNGDGAITVNGVPLSGRSAPVSGGANAELCIEVQDGKVDNLSFTLE